MLQSKEVLVNLQVGCKFEVQSSQRRERSHRRNYEVSTPNARPVHFQENLTPQSLVLGTQNQTCPWNLSGPMTYFEFLPTRKYGAQKISDEFGNRIGLGSNWLRSIRSGVATANRRMSVKRKDAESASLEPLQIVFPGKIWARRQFRKCIMGA